MVSSSATNADLPNVVPGPDGVPPRRCPTTRPRVTASPKFLKAKYAGQERLLHPRQPGVLARASPTRSPPRQPPTATPTRAQPSSTRHDDLYSSAVNSAKAAKADVVFYGGYYAEAGKLKKQLTDAERDIHLRQRRRLARPRLPQRRRRAGRRRDHLLPVQPRHRDRCRRARQRSPRTTRPSSTRTPAPTRPRRSTPPTSSWTASRRATPPAPSCSPTSRASTTYDGISKTIEFEDNGNLKATTVYFFDVKDGKFTSLAEHRRLLEHRLRRALEEAAIKFCTSCLADEFWPQTVDGVTLGAIYALIALGYTLVYGVLRLINFAHSEVFMVGAFGSLFALHAIGIDTAHAPPSGFGLAGVLLVMVLAGMVASGVAGRRSRAARLPAAAQARRSTAGVPHQRHRRVAVHAGALRAALRPRRACLSRAWSNRDTVFTLFGADVQVPQAARVRLRGRSDGRARPLRRHDTASAAASAPPRKTSQTAQLMGVDINRIIVVTFLLGGLVAGAAGALYFGVVVETVRYNSGFIYGIKAFTAAVLGGIGNIRGALLGGFALGLLESYGATRARRRMEGRVRLHHPRPRADVPADGHPRRTTREVTGMTSTRATARGASGAAGRAFELSRRQRLIAMAAFGVAGASAVPPFLSAYLQSVLFFPVGIYVLLAIGLNVVVGAAGMLDLGYVAFFAVGAYTTAILTTTVRHGRVVGDPVRDRHRHDRRRVARRADTAAARRLPRDRHPRLRRDRAHHRAQHQRARRSPAASPTSSTPSRSASERCPTTTSLSRAIAIAFVVSMRLNASRVGRVVVGHPRRRRSRRSSWACPRSRCASGPSPSARRRRASPAGSTPRRSASSTPTTSRSSSPSSSSPAVVLGGSGSLPGVIAGGFLIAFLPEYLRDAAAGKTITKFLNRIIGSDAEQRHRLPRLAVRPRPDARDDLSTARDSSRRGSAAWSTTDAPDRSDEARRPATPA